MRNRMGKYSQKKNVRRASKKRAGLSLPAVIIIDILMVGVILVVFAFFHHVLPSMISEYERQQAVLNATEPMVTQPPTAAPTQPPEATQAGETVPAETQPVETEAPDNRTEWQKKFEAHFSDEIIQTQNSYSSPNVSINVETVKLEDERGKITYHVADIYIGSMENFTTYTADGEMRYFGVQDVLEMDEAANALLSMSGDFLTYQKGGFLMRNGVAYAENTNTASICVLYADGSMETYDGKTYDIETIKEKGAVQVWSFGPVLLDEDGKARTTFKNVSSAVSYTNPRSAIGYYEPGHYCFVVVDGRQEGYSVGMKLADLAAVFEELGCKAAYNLDGGGSAVMVFNHERYSRQSNGGDRGLGDILVIRESAGLASGGDQEAAE